MSIVLIIILFIVLFIFDLWFGSLLSKEIINLSNMLKKLEKSNLLEYKKFLRYYGKDFDKLYHKQPESFPISLLTNLRDMNQVSSLQERIKSAL